MSENSLTGSFLEPPPSSKGLKGFHLRKRKRKIADFLNGSCISSPLSESSFISNSVFEMTTSGPNDLVPEVKRKRSLSRMTSAISTPMAKMSSVLQRSLSSARLHGCPSPHKGTPTRFLRSASSVSHVCDQSMVSLNGSDSPALKRGTAARNSASKLTPYKPPQPTPNKQRPTRFWSEKYPDSVKRLTAQEVKLQEAIYELVCGEEDLVKDLLMIQKNYADPLVQLHILTSSEADMVFGKLRGIIPLHADLHSSLIRLRCPTTGISSSIGQILFKWVEKVQDPYVDYCASLIRTKAFLDHRRETDKFFSDFLQRCLESGFSRKLDLWSYLDVPRSKLVKYPLLLRQVVKFSASGTSSAEVQLLSLAIQKLESVLHRVDSSMAEAKCQFTISRLEWLDEAVEVRCHAVRKAREELLDGTLRNNRGTKLECHLLDTVLILGRPSSRLSSLPTVPSTSSLMSSSSSTSSLMSTASVASVQQQQQQGGHQNHHPGSSSPPFNSHGVDFNISCGKRLQVYRTPIPLEEMLLEDLNPSQSTNSSFSDHTTSSGVASMSMTANGGAKPGSFRSAFGASSNTGNRNGFRVSFRQASDGQAHTLFAPDEHSKRQWMAAIRKAMQSLHGDSHPMQTELTNGNGYITGSFHSGMEGLLIIENGSSVSETDFSVSCIIESPSKPVKRVYAHDGKVAKCQLTPVKAGLFQKHKRSPRIKTALSQTALESVKTGGAVKKIRSTASARKLNENYCYKSSSTSALGGCGSLDQSVVVLSAIAAQNSASRLRRKSSQSPEVKSSNYHLQLPNGDGSRPNGDSLRRQLSNSENSHRQLSNGDSLRRQAVSSGSLAAAAVGKRILKQQLKTQQSSTAVVAKSGTAFRSRTKSWGHLTRVGNASYHGDVFEGDKSRRYNTRSVSKKISKSMSDLLEL